ncbi:MAG TPA: hypothetical protein VFK07_01950 [Candidatus Paceibacterota bacterium]|nr:hypothetical protein [Candidatus Paceibacterota bacterium]
MPIPRTAFVVLDELRVIAGLKGNLIRRKKRRGKLKGFDRVRLAHYTQRLEDLRKEYQDLKARESRQGAS